MQLLIHGDKQLVGGNWQPFGSLCAAALNISKLSVSELDSLAAGKDSSRALVGEKLAALGLAPAADCTAQRALELMDELIAFRVYMRRWLSRLEPYADAKYALSSLPATVNALEKQLRRGENTRRTTLPLEIEAKHEFLAASDEKGVNLIAEKLEFRSLRELLLYDMLSALERQRPPRCCKCCGSWFVPVRKNEIYCPGKAENGRPCREFGAQESFRRASSGELHRVFDAACSRVYTKKSRGRLSAEEAKRLIRLFRAQYNAAQESGLAAEELERRLREAE